MKHKGSHRLLSAYKILRKEILGGSIMGPEILGVVSSGNVTDEAREDYIKKQKF